MGGDACPAKKIHDTCGKSWETREKSMGAVFLENANDWELHYVPKTALLIVFHLKSSLRVTAKPTSSQAWLPKTVIPALKFPKSRNHKIKDSLCYTSRPCLKMNYQATRSRETIILGLAVIRTLSWDHREHHREQMGRPQCFSPHVLQTLTSSRGQRLEIFQWEGTVSHVPGTQMLGEGCGLSILESLLHPLWVKELSWLPITI